MLCKVWQQMSKRAVELAGVGLLAEKNPHTRWGGIGRCGGQW